MIDENKPKKIRGAYIDVGHRPGDAIPKPIVSKHQQCFNPCPPKIPRSVMDEAYARVYGQRDKCGD